MTIFSSLWRDGTKGLCSPITISRVTGCFFLAKKWCLCEEIIDALGNSHGSGVGVVLVYT